MTGSRIHPPKAKPDPAVMLISDFEQFLQLLSSWDGTIEQLTCGRLQGSMKVAQGLQMHAHIAEANQSIMLRGRERPGVCTFTLVLPVSSACLWQGRRLDAGTLVVRSGNVEVDHRSSRNAVNLSVAFPETALLRAARSLTRTEMKTLNWLALQTSPGGFSKLETCIRRFLDEATAPNVSRSQDVRVQEEACLRAVISTIQPAKHSRGSDLSLPARTHLTRLAEQIMRAHLNGPLGEVDLCETLNVSGRTLRLAFRERYCLGPMAYFQTLRLNAVRDQLIAANPETTSVAMVARAFGFGHLGKFAGYYRRLFGELPSRTFARERRSVSLEQEAILIRCA